MSDVAPAEIAPIEAARRIKTLDVLRGLAILGILVVNAPFFSAPWQTAINPTLQPLAIDQTNAWTWFVPHVFFEVKFITLFSLLFGASLFLVGGERSDPERGKVLRRRLGWMLLFGVIHGAAIWYGDILLVYAVSGLVVMFARSWRARTLMMVGGVLYAVLCAFAFLVGAAISFAPAEVLAEVRTQVWTPEAPTLAATIAGFGGSFAESLSANFDVWSYFIVHELTNTVPRTIAVMMIGLALFKWGFFSGNARAWVYWLVVVVGAAALAAVAYQAQINYAAGFDFMHMQSRGALLNPALSILITLMYASLLILCVKSGVLGFVTNALAPVGQMAFTNYIAQSLIMTAIFYGGRGLGLYGEVNRETLLMIVAGVWAAQLVWSPLWLSKFRMGPLEWVWRRLSYGKPLAITKAAAA
ncbi:MAG: DUF418 domain-containing protein [Hyphomonadaceae bacterium]|nr:DUF418 domain-containing protein [Hyphomonadaceae bacterium]